MKPGRFLLLVGIFALQAAAWAGTSGDAAFNEAMKDYLTVQSVELQEESDSFEKQILKDEIPSTGDIELDQIIAIGEKVWDIIVKNKPISNIETKPGVHVIPTDLDGRWNRLQGWKAPSYKTYTVVYKNTYGMEVIKFKFTFSYNFNGNYYGKGRFLSNVKIIPKEAYVSWGYQFNAKVVVDDRALNVGTAAQPIAGLGLQVQWKVSTVMSDIQEAQDIFVDGLGRSSTTNAHVVPEFGVLN